MMRAFGADDVVPRLKSRKLRFQGIAHILRHSRPLRHDLDDQAEYAVAEYEYRRGCSSPVIAVDAFAANRVIRERRRMGEAAG